jgi:SAM-dependent methyltransferase
VSSTAVPRSATSRSRQLLGSRIELRDLNVYDLDLADVGDFDLVVMGYVLQMLRDPLRGLEAVRRVCRGHLIVLETVSRPLELLPAPLARLDARRDGSEWFVFNRRGLRRALELAGWVVEETTPVLRDRPGPVVGRRKLALGPRTMHTLGIRGRSAAIRARPLLQTVTTAEQTSVES